MDGHTFDALTKVWRSAASRRRALGGLLGGVASLGAAGSTHAEQPRRLAGARCTKNAHCCSNSCVGRVCEATCPNNCSGNGRCDATTGTCTCAPGFRGLDCSMPCGIAMECARPGLYHFCDLVCCSGQYGCDSISGQEICYCT